MHAAEDKKTNLNFQLVIKLSGSVHTKIYSREWVTQSIIY